jgi:hypothetical protein
MPESKMIWAICSKFNVLPNDPLVRGLTPFQRVWIVSNMNAEYEAQQRILKGGDSKQTTVSSDGMTAADLQSIIGMAKAHGAGRSK